MNKFSENQIWLSEAGTSVIRKKFRGDLDQLSDWEHLVYCVWQTDFTLRTVGRIDQSPASDPKFRNNAAAIADALDLPVTVDTFRLSMSDLNREFELRFEAVCDELRVVGDSADPSSTHTAHVDSAGQLQGTAMR